MEKKTLSFFPPTICPSASSSRNHLGCRKKKGRIDRWQEGRERQLSRQLSCILRTLIFLPRSNATKCAQKSKHLIPLLSKEKESHSKTSIHKISIYQIKKQEEQTSVPLSDYLFFFSFWTCTIMKGRH